MDSSPHVQGASLGKEWNMGAEPFENKLKLLLQRNAKTAGAWLTSGSAIAAEIISRAGFDWILVDMEHGPSDMMTLTAQLQAMNGSGVTPIVRAPWNDFVMIKRILDAGAHGIIVPYVNDGPEAENAVKACKYPPRGIRGVASLVRAAGYGFNAVEYFRKANQEILVIVQVETTAALANLDEILEVQGIDVIFIGPFDLASSMGHLGDPGQPDVQAAIARVESAVKKKGKYLATVSSGWEEGKTLYERGYEMVALMYDVVSLGASAVEITSKFRSAFPRA
jgi:2-keto-3-deoxy-L-rhamnonate aldolase RhmA